MSSRHRGLALYSSTHIPPRPYKWVGGRRHTPAVLPPGNRPLAIVQEAGWASRPVWMGLENLAPTGVRNPDRRVGASGRHTDCAIPAA